VVANLHEYLATGAALKPDGPARMPAEAQVEQRPT